MAAVLYLLVGFYYEQRRVLGVHRDRSAYVETPVAVFFSGQICHDNRDPSEPLVGEIREQVGSTTLSDIELTDDRLSFFKWYNSVHWVSYDLKRQEDGSWFGTYTGENDGESFDGTARCFLSTTDWDLIDADLITHVEMKAEAAKKKGGKKRKK